jgi:hypothetical protein
MAQRCSCGRRAFPRCSVDSTQGRGCHSSFRCVASSMPWPDVMVHAACLCRVPPARVACLVRARADSLPSLRLHPPVEANSEVRATNELRTSDLRATLWHSRFVTASTSICFMHFRCMFHIFHLDVVYVSCECCKSRSGVVYVVMAILVCCKYMFSHVSAFSSVRCNVFHLDVVKVDLVLYML